jgi:RES domain-containing protein
MRTMNADLGRAMRRIRGRREAGRWLHITVEDPDSGAVELVEFQDQGGRLNPPRSFPVMYCAEDNDACRAGMLRLIREERESGTKFVVMHLEICLHRVLDLGDAAIRKRLGVSRAALDDFLDMRLGQSLGDAAHKAGFAGIIYPRPLGKGARNLALFCDRAGTKNVSIVGAGTLES